MSGGGLSLAWRANSNITPNPTPKRLLGMPHAHGHSSAAVDPPVATASSLALCTLHTLNHLFHNLGVEVWLLWSCIRVQDICSSLVRVPTLAHLTSCDTNRPLQPCFFLSFSKIWYISELPRFEHQVHHGPY